jgi:hypothetical protein
MRRDRTTVGKRHTVRGAARYLMWLRKRRARLRSFRPVDDTDKSVRMDMDSPSKTLLIAFGGLDMRIGMPPFEFFALTDGLPVKRLFLRDTRHAWYHRGVPQHGDSLTATADALGELIATLDVERLVTAGASAGGYAALAFGTLLGADTALSFSPQTTLERSDLKRFGDKRWNDHLRPLRRQKELDRNWTDLRVAMPRARCADTRYEVFVDESLRVDRLHVERLLGLEGVHVYRFGGGNHGLVRMLRDNGALQLILGRALAPAAHASGEGVNEPGGARVSAGHPGERDGDRRPPQP